MNRAELRRSRADLSSASTIFRGDSGTISFPSSLAPFDGVEGRNGKTATPTALPSVAQIRRTEPFGVLLFMQSDYRN